MLCIILTLKCSSLIDNLKLHLLAQINMQIVPKSYNSSRSYVSNTWGITKSPKSTKPQIVRYDTTTI